MNGDLVSGEDSSGVNWGPGARTQNAAQSEVRLASERGAGIHSSTLALGSELRDCIDRLVSLTESLSKHAEPDVAKLVQRACSAFDGQICRIAVLGQTQSGKSSLINALTKCDGLLPTGSAPWTAVLTRLHVGHKVSTDSRAVFSFFDESEWHRLSEQGGRIRELAERLLPGFDSVRLRSQLADVRQRVRKKLGPSYFELCGQEHTFDTILPSTVARYVGGGDNADCEYASRGRDKQRVSPVHEPDGPAQADLQGALTGAEGMYSELTRSADLYLAGNPRSFPFTLIDTPGTNDPFLVREEITIGATEDADICLVVLDATRLISEADVALLRILRSLGRDRIVVFVNKIDQLGDVVEDVKSLQDALRKVFSREVPSAHVSFVFGSANWALMSRSSTTDFNSEKARADLIAYAAYATDLPANKRAKWERSYLRDSALRQSVLEVCSGLPELEATLSWKICRSRLGTYVHQASATFASVANNAASALETDAAMLRREHSTVQQEKLVREGERNKRRSEVERLRRLVEQLELQCKRSVDSLYASKQDFKNRLEARLRDEIRAFADYHSEALLRALQSGEGVRTVVCDPNPLRQRVGEIFVQEFRRTRHSIMNNQRLSAARLQYILSQVLPDTNVELDFGQLSNSWVYPSLMPLGQTLTFDLGRSWWTQWWKRRKDPEVMASSLRRLILDEFIPISAQVVEIAEQDISSEIDTAVWQLALSRNKVTHCIEDRQKVLDSDRAKLIAGGDGNVEDASSDLAERVKRLEERAADCRKLAEQFTSLAMRWEPPTQNQPDQRI